MTACKGTTPASFVRLFACLLAFVFAFPSVAFAAGDTTSVATSGTLYENTTSVDVSGVEISAEEEAASVTDATFAVADFTRNQKGSNRDVNGTYIGYSYYQGSSVDETVAIVNESYVLVHITADHTSLFDVTSTEDQDLLKTYFIALDEVSLSGGIIMDDDRPWYFTTDTSVTIGDVTYNFGVEGSEGKYYVTVIGADGSDIVSADASAKPTHVDFLNIQAQENVTITEEATGFAALAEFLSGVDMSPLWVTLRTTGAAIVFIFILGLAAAYFSMRIPKRAQDIADTIFTIPMVLPPTVCGFVLLLLLGNNSSFGTWLMSIGIKLVFSWEATVVAAVVVAFPLMYRSARGAFENLDPNMLDAARTLGWSNLRIFFKLMMPLSWSSIAAGTVLAFARALGEFGATLFLAGNYAGITRTIPIAIYFEWMSGNTDVAVFWTVVIIIFSFIVILFINLWSRRTTKYRRGIEE